MSKSAIRDAVSIMSFDNEFFRTTRMMISGISLLPYLRSAYRSRVRIGHEFERPQDPDRSENSVSRIMRSKLHNKFFIHFFIPKISLNILMIDMTKVGAFVNLQRFTTPRILPKFWSCQRPVIPSTQT